MLTLAILIPLVGALVLAVMPKITQDTARVIAVGTSAVSFLLLLIVWARFDTSAGAPAFQSLAEIEWIPSLGVAWRVGVDGMSLALSLMSGVLFIACTAATWTARRAV